jgi:hypothetical protein
MRVAVSSISHRSRVPTDVGMKRTLDPHTFGWWSSSDRGQTFFGHPHRLNNQPLAALHWLHLPKVFIVRMKAPSCPVMPIQWRRCSRWHSHLWVFASFPNVFTRTTHFSAVLRAGSAHRQVSVHPVQQRATRSNAIVCPCYSADTAKRSKRITRIVNLSTSHAHPLLCSMGSV